MVRFIETIVILTLLLFSFFVGVKYSEQVKKHIGWIIETEEVKHKLPQIQLPEKNNKVIKNSNTIDNTPAKTTSTDKNSQDEIKEVIEVIEVIEPDQTIDSEEEVDE